MSKIKLYQVDAFTDRLFRGNPAAVCPLRRWPSKKLLQDIAIENNLAETAFFVRKNRGYELRWFTPEAEVDLCGHATLASAHVIFRHLGYPEAEIRFETRFVGELRVRRHGEWLTLDLPSWPPQRLAKIPPQAAAGLRGARPREAHRRRDLLLVYERESQVRALRPDFAKLRDLRRWICVTAPGSGCDFVSRFFCPEGAVPEDPVTGSAHCMLTPYWAERLGKTRLSARQLSPRGGELRCELRGDRVWISGRATTYLVGEIADPGGRRR